MKLSRKKIISCSICLLIFILVATIVLIDKERVIDEAIYNFIFNFRCNLLDNYFTFITHFGDTIFIVCFVTIFILIQRKKESLFLAISAIDSSLLTWLLKQLFLRERPSHLKLIKQGGYSFPSGHAMISMCVYGYLFYLVLKIKNKPLKYILIFILSLLIISIGISRIYVGVHYPTDVIAGYLIGLIEVILVTEVLNIYKTRGN